MVSHTLRVSGSEQPFALIHLSEVKVATCFHFNYYYGGEEKQWIDSEIAVHFTCSKHHAVSAKTAPCIVSIGAAQR